MRWPTLWVVPCLFLLTVATALAAKPESKREQQREKQELNKDQARLDALEREEKALRKEVDRLEKQLPGAKKALDKAEEEARSIDKQVAKTRRDLEQAKDDARDAKRRLAEIVRETEERQPADAPFGQARAAYLAAKEEYAAAVDAVEKSAEYKAAHAAAVESPAALLPQLRKKWIDENPAVTAAREKVQATKPVYERLLDELLRKVPAWQKASQEADRAHDGETEAEKLLNTLAAARGQVKGMESALAKTKHELKSIPGKKESLRREIERDRREVRDKRK